MDSLRLRAGRYPVIDEEHALTSPEQSPSHSKGELAVEVIRRHSSAQPGVAVGSRRRVLAHRGQSNPKVNSHECAQHQPAGLHPDDHVDVLLGVQGRQCWAEVGEQVGLAPPAVQIRPAGLVCPIPTPSEGRAQSLRQVVRNHGYMVARASSLLHVERHVLRSACLCGSVRGSLPLAGHYPDRLEESRRANHAATARCRPWETAIPASTTTAPTGWFHCTCSPSTLTPTTAATTGVR